MKRQELAKLFAERARLSKSNALFLMDHIFDVITESLEDGEEVQIRRFGTFRVAEQNGRKTVEFAPSKVLIEAMKETKYRQKTDREKSTEL